MKIHNVVRVLSLTYERKCGDGVDIDKMYFEKHSLRCYIEQASMSVRFSLTGKEEKHAL